MAAMECRFVKTQLEQMLNRPIFLDSDNLKDLRELLNHVRNTECLVLFQVGNHEWVRRVKGRRQSVSLPACDDRRAAPFP